MGGTTSVTGAPAAPATLRCIERLADGFYLEFQVIEPVGFQVTSCEVQVSGSWSWSDVTYEQGKQPQRVRADIWQATVRGLESSTVYDLRVRGNNAGGEGKWLQKSFKTSDAPAAPSALQRTARTATRLSLEWQVADPEGAPVTDCQVELGASFGWTAAAHLEGKPRRLMSEKWQTIITGLSGDTLHSIRVRGVNAAGEGEWSRTCEFMTSPVPQAPFSLRCTRRLATKLKLEWHVEDPDGAEVAGCFVQMAGSLNWKTVQFENDAKPERIKDNVWCGIVAGLASNTEYMIRVCGYNGAGSGAWTEPTSFKTSEMPAEPTELQCSKRLVDKLSLSWRVLDPEGAPVTGCEINIGGSLSWIPATFESGGKPQRSVDDRWHAALSDLLPDTVYDVCIRGTSEAGEGKWSAPHKFKTSERPPKPLSFRAFQRFPTKLGLEWTLVDPEGAEVTSCEVQIGGSLSWALATIEGSRGPQRSDGGRWSASLVDLAGDTVYDVRVRGHNQCGSGIWAQLPFKTSEAPKAPHSFRCVRRCMDKLFLEWLVEDPEGAAVTSCVVHIGGQIGWRMATFESEAQAIKAADGKWQTTIVELGGNTEYEIRVCGRNEVGEGLWSQQRFKTSELPAAPLDFKCIQRSADKLLLRWTVFDPEGADITSCCLQVGGPLGWSTIEFEDDAEPWRKKDAEKDCEWQVLIPGLIGDTEYVIRVCGRNAIGNGMWAQNQFKTSERPEEPTSLEATCRGPTKISLKWYVQGSLGADLTGCELEVKGAYSWAQAELEKDIECDKEGWWRATLINLSGETAYNVRVRGCSAAGAGAWKQAQFKTSDRPAVPVRVESKRRLPDKLFLDWQVLDPEGADVLTCDVQVEKSLWWADAAFDQVPRRGEGDFWSAAVTGLEMDTPYGIRIRAINAAGIGNWSEKITFRTTGKPDKPFGFRWRHLNPGKVSLEWRVEELEGAEIKCCELEVLVTPAVGGAPYWEAPVHDTAQAPCRVQGDFWRCELLGLSLNTTHGVRFCGVNMAGRGPWLRQDIQTSAPPPAPTTFRCARKHEEELSLEWRIVDPAGAEVKTCELQFSTSMFSKWDAAVFRPGKEPRRVGGELWQATLSNLNRNTSYNLRVRGCSSAGEGSWTQDWFDTAS